MKLIYLANIRLPTEKAHGVQIMKMCEAFAGAGVQVELVVPTRRSSITADPFVFYGVRPVFSIVRVCVPDTVWLGPVGFILQSVWFALAARRYARRSGGAAIYSRDAAVVALGRPGRIVWEMHTASWSGFARRAARKAKGIVAISQGIADFFAARGVPQRTLLVAHDAVDLAEYAALPSRADARAQLALPTSRTILEYVGKLRTMGHPKGVEEILEAAATVVKQRPEALLLLVGLNTDEFAAAGALAKRYGLGEGDCVLVGHKPRFEVPLWLRAADVLVMNYPNTEHYAKMMSPLKVFEYMASGTPMVSTDLPSLREVLPETAAYYVAPGSTQALAAGILQAIDDAAAPERAERARQAVAEHTWARRAQKILSFMSSCVD